MPEDIRQVTHIDNVRLGEDERSVVIIDQSQLPNRTVYLTQMCIRDRPCPEPNQ